MTVEFALSIRQPWAYAILHLGKDIVFVIESVPYRTFFCNNVGENVGHITGQKTAIVSVVSLPKVRWLEKGGRNG